MLYAKGVLTKTSHEEIIDSYNYLMQKRFKNQVEALNNNVKVDNYLDPKELSNIEQIMLKKIFAQISNFQAKLNYEFVGSIN